MVEIMIVIAIIGILTAVAIPSFHKYKARSKRTEAKILLSSIYVAQAGLMQVFNHYATCLEDANFELSNAQNRHYAIGFANENTAANSLVVGSGGECANGGYQYPASNHFSGQLVPASALSDIDSSTSDAGAGITTPGVLNTGEAFVAGAIGYIFPGNITTATASKWTINHEKQIMEINPGF